MSLPVFRGRLYRSAGGVFNAAPLQIQKKRDRLLTQHRYDYNAIAGLYNGDSSADGTGKQSKVYMKRGKDKTTAVNHTTAAGVMFARLHRAGSFINSFLFNVSMGSTHGEGRNKGKNT